MALSVIERTAKHTGSHIATAELAGARVARRLLRGRDLILTDSLSFKANQFRMLHLPTWCALSVVNAEPR